MFVIIGTQKLDTVIGADSHSDKTFSERLDFNFFQKFDICSKNAILIRIQIKANLN